LKGSYSLLTKPNPLPGIVFLLFYNFLNN